MGGGGRSLKATVVRLGANGNGKGGCHESRCRRQRSFTAIGEFFQEGDVIGAINELINIPANITNGVLNGAGFLDLTGIISAIAPLPIEGVKIGLNVGGLLNAVPKDGSLVPDAPNPPTEYSGGIGLDSLAVQGPINASGLPNGWAGSVVGLGQFLGEQLVVTPPPLVGGAAVEEPQASKLAAPVVVPATAEVVESAPVVVEAEADEPAPVVVAEVEEAVPADIDVAEIEAAVAEVEAEVADAEAAAVAEDNTPAAATGSDDSDDTSSRATDSRRGAASED